VNVHKLSNSQLQRLIRSIAADGARVYYTNHAQTRMRHRHVTQEIVLEVLQQGKLVGIPEPNAARGSLECRMERYRTGRQIRVIVAVSDDDPDLIVVTVIEL
jgi:Domain of unknown function (DUF4258)